jgi:peptide/nickel transport system ATP-binding protein/oligopeptide transport system ATP-binding protein
MTLLSINSLCTYFKTRSGIARAVDGVSLEIHKGEVLGIVGESGCGKSVLALSILRLLAMPPAYFADGEILFKDKDLIKLTNNDIRAIRGDRISMIFQEPMSALNPVYTIGNQLSEVFRVHHKSTQKQAMDKSLDILTKVGIPDPFARLKEYPHQLSGGLRQRVMIAMALGCRPELLISDEPTTALDVTIQAQILELITKLKDDLGTAVMMITHDLGVIAETTDRVMVMYTGNVMETATTVDLFENPKHPYTKGLLKAIPGVHSDESADLYEITGTVPSLFDLPRGCKFNTRCPEVRDICREKQPELLEIDKGHKVACWNVTHE